MRDGQVRVESATSIEPRHAILLATRYDGWVWELIDADGVSVATGVSPDRDGAMNSAQRTSSLMAGADR